MRSRLPRRLSSPGAWRLSPVARRLSFVVLSGDLVRARTLRGRISSEVKTRLPRCCVPWATQISPCTLPVARLWRRCLACPGRVCGVCATGSIGASASIGRFWDWRLRGRQAGPTRTRRAFPSRLDKIMVAAGSARSGRRLGGTRFDVTLGARSQCRDKGTAARGARWAFCIRRVLAGSPGLAGPGRGGC
jgi:hypothetical protein